MAIFPRIKTWVSNEVLTAGDLNSEFNNLINHFDSGSVEGYSHSVSEMQSAIDPYPGSAESLASTIAGELQRLRYAIRKISGAAQWYIPPTNTVDSPITTTRIADGAVTPLKLSDFDIANPATTGIPSTKIRDGAITQSKKGAVGQVVSTAAPTGLTSSATFIDVTNLTVTITTNGRPVFVGLMAGNNTDGIYAGKGTATGAGGTFQITRTTSGATSTVYTGTVAVSINIMNTPVYQSMGGIGTLVGYTTTTPASGGTDVTLPASSVWTVDDNVPATTHVYKVQVKANGGSLAGISGSTVKLIAFEL